MHPNAGWYLSVFYCGYYFLPPESRLASGQSKSPTPKKVKRGRRKLNSVGRRFQLASELIRQVPWMGRASVPRIAWILKEVSDAGWTADEVIAFLDCGDAPSTVHRPSGFLAGRLKGATTLWPTAEGRARAVDAYRDSRRAEQARHQEWEGVWQAPRSESVRRLVAEAFAPRSQQPLDNSLVADLPAHGHHAEDEAPDLEQLTREQVRDWRVRAMKDHQVVFDHIDAFGETSARRLFSNQLVNEVQRLSGTHHLVLGHTTWRSA
ncbi:hypothetical protein ACFQ10_54405 [Streptomyces indonesiensis]